MSVSFSAILDVAIGLVFVFLLVSLICSQINDKIATWLRMRAKGLEEGLRKYITGETQLTKDLYDNPLIQSLIPEDAWITQFIESKPLLKKLIRAPKNPLGIHAKTFSLALFDILVPTPGAPISIGQLQTQVQNLPKESPIRAPLLSIIATAGSSIDTVRGNLEAWYDSAMDKTTKLYQAHMWHLALAIGLSVAVILNVDTIAVGTRLWSDSSLRSTLVAEANKYAQGTPEKEKALAQLNALNLPIGWQVKTAPDAKDFFAQLQTLSITPSDWTTVPGQTARVIGLWDYIWKVCGLLVTALAGAQGAPFWFDLLRKLTRR
ncbi:MAG: hypothetical protein FJ009_20610 [Chloroflexi bacterium]|nr:hypothetical protein [Chloroflexota bacterium]